MSMRNVSPIEHRHVDPAIVRTLKGHRSPISSIAFHPCPSLLATRKKNLHVQDIEQIASSSIDGELTVWNFSHRDDDVRAYRYMGHTGPIHHVTYSPSGSLLASCSSDKTTRLWVPKANGESTILKGHTAPVRCVDFSPTSTREDISLLVTCSDDKSVKVWNLPNRTFRTSLTGENCMLLTQLRSWSNFANLLLFNMIIGHTNWVRSCKFSPDSTNIVASAGDDGTIRIWDVTQGKSVVTYSGKEDETKEIRGVHFHPSGTIIAGYGSDGFVRLYDLRSDEIIKTFRCRSKKRFSSIDNRNGCGGGLAFHPSGQYVLIGNDQISKRGDHCFKLWDIRHDKSKHSITHGGLNSCQNALEKHSPSCCCCVFSHNGAKFATGGMDKVVSVWDSNKITDAFEGAGKTKSRESPFIKSKPRAINTQIEYITENIAKLESSTDDTSNRNESNDVQSVESEGIHLPETLAGTLEHIVGQIDLLTRTLGMISNHLTSSFSTHCSLKMTLDLLALIEERLSIQEENMRNLRGDEER